MGTDVRRKKHGGADPVQVQWEQEFHDHSSDYHQVQRRGWVREQTRMSDLHERNRE